MLRNRQLIAVPGSPWCLGCRRRPVSWNGLVCDVCAEGARARRRRRRRAAVALRWAGASVIDGLVGVGAGGLALLPLAAPPGRAGLGLSVAAILLLLALAGAVLFAHAWLLRPVLRRWLLWSAVDGAELAGHWLLVLGALLALGHHPGVLAAVTAVSGIGAALAQSRALVGQAPAPWRWAAWSAAIWLAAAGATLAWELAAPGPLVAVIGGAALGRLVYALLAGPALALVLVPPRR